MKVIFIVFHFANKIKFLDKKHKRKIEIQFIANDSNP